jgi:hypothetical protein
MPSRSPPFSPPACRRRGGRRAFVVGVLGLVALDFVVTTPAWSANVTPPDAPAKPPATPSRLELTPEEQLQRLVPERVGAWKRSSLGERLPERVEAADAKPVVEAEFRNADKRATVSVSDAGAASAQPYRGEPMRTANDEGREATYHEGDATVLEKVRRIDGAAQVTLLRDDGIVIVVSATGIPPQQLKRLAQGIRPRSAMSAGK